MMNNNLFSSSFLFVCLFHLELFFTIIFQYVSFINVEIVQNYASIGYVYI